MKIRKMIALATALVVASQASATTINGTGLQNGLNNITVGDPLGLTDADFRDVNSGQAGSDEHFTMQDTGIGGASLLFEFAGFANRNTFGIYDIFDPSNRLEIFNGPSSSGALSVTWGLGNTFTAFGLLDAPTGSATFTSSVFGFYLDGPGGLFFSQDSLNNGYDQMVGFQGDGSEYIVQNGFPLQFTDASYILAWEDLRLPGGDRDYSDMVVMVSGVQAVPAPAGIALLGLGLLGLGFARKRA